jgi:hypothetical protein
MKKTLAHLPKATQNELKRLTDKIRELSEDVQLMLQLGWDLEDG